MEKNQNDTQQTPSAEELLTQGEQWIKDHPVTDAIDQQQRALILLFTAVHEYFDDINLFYTHKRKHRILAPYRCFYDALLQQWWITFEDNGRNTDHLYIEQLKVGIHVSEALIKLIEASPNSTEHKDLDNIKAQVIVLKDLIANSESEYINKYGKPYKEMGNDAKISKILKHTDSHQDDLITFTRLFYDSCGVMHSRLSSLLETSFLKGPINFDALFELCKVMYKNALKDAQENY